MLTINPPHLFSFFSFPFYLFSFTFQKKSENFGGGGGLNPPLKYALARGAKQGGGWGVATPPEFWMGGLNTCQPQGWGQVQLTKYSSTPSTSNIYQVQVLVKYSFFKKVLKYIKYFHIKYKYKYSYENLF